VEERLSNPTIIMSRSPDALSSQSMTYERADTEAIVFNPSPD
jgi:hypothetical protein